MFTYKMSKYTHTNKHKKIQMVTILSVVQAKFIAFSFLINYSCWQLIYQNYQIYIYL